jgi:hypothetical protein
MPSICLSVALCHLSACIPRDGGLYPIIAWRLAAGLPCLFFEWDCAWDNKQVAECWRKV